MRCFPKFFIVGVSLNRLWTSSFLVALALLFVCLTTSALFVVHIFDKFFRVDDMLYLVRDGANMTPAATLFAIFHSLSSSGYVSNPSAVGRGVTEIPGVVPGVLVAGYAGQQVPDRMRGM